MKDHNRRLMAAKFEVKRKLCKALVRDPDLPSELKDKHRYKLAKLPRNSAFFRIRNHCILHQWVIVCRGQAFFLHHELIFALVVSLN